MNYYNEWEPFAGEWLKELIKDGLIPDGTVDNRSIADVEPSDLKGFTQCHFFAGIGGWSRALQIAGWSPDRPVWTGSPPCQSFSTAGKGKGKDDERHLWPVFFNLIRECQPPTVFGEQVAAAIRFGWLDDLQDDFEAEGYASAAVVLPSGSIGAYHKRDRLFFAAKRMADTTSGRHKQSEQFSNGCSSQSDKRQSDSSGNCESQRQLMAYSNSSNRGSKQESKQQARDQWGQSNGNSRSNGSVGNAEHDGSYGAEVGRSAFETSNCGKKGQDVSCESEGAGRSEIARDIRFWDDSTTIYCRDGKHRPIPVEPALFPLVNGLSNRVGILRGTGNAIVPQAAAEIIKAYMETYIKLE